MKWARLSHCPAGPTCYRIRPGRPACYPRPPPALAESVVLAEPAPRAVRAWYRAEFPAASSVCRAHSRRRGGHCPGGAAGAQGLRGPRGSGASSSSTRRFRSGVLGGPAPGPCPPAGRAAPRRASRAGLPGLCFQRAVSLRSRLDPRRCADATPRLATAPAPERSIRMFIKYSIYAVCPRSHRPKIKSAV